jgi:hypothetical protein
MCPLAGPPLSCGVCPALYACPLRAAPRSPQLVGGGMRCGTRHALIASRGSTWQYHTLGSPTGLAGLSDLAMITYSHLGLVVCGSRHHPDAAGRLTPPTCVT